MAACCRSRRRPAPTSARTLSRSATRRMRPRREARVQALLSRPLSAEAAVQIALLNNRGLQAAYNELGISEAQMVEASLPPSPAFALSKLFTSAQFEIERQIVQNVLGLLTLPRRREIAEDRVPSGPGARRRSDAAHGGGGAARLLSRRGGQSDRAVSWQRRGVGGIDL